MELAISAENELGQEICSKKVYVAEVESVDDYVKFMIGVGIDMGFDSETLASLHVKYLEGEL